MRYRVLGPIEVVDDEPEGRTSVAVGGPQQRRLLGVLLTYPDRVVSTDHLVEALWPDVDPPSGANRSVLTYVSRLRASLGREVIVSQGNGYRLDRTAGNRDIDAFETLITEAERSLPDRAVACYDEALALWRGRPFGEFGDEWWAIAETTRLAELFVTARERRASALLKIGHHDRAIPDLEGLIVEYPLRERPASLLVQALHSSGRTAEALRAARAFRDRLADETGLEPTVEFAGLERSIADGSADGGESAGTVPLRGYTLGEPIGEGASGRVYVGIQPGTGRRVAVKVVRPDLADSAEFIRRFEAEARLVARLEHPHIVPLYDFWREPGGAYLVFRLLPGGSVLESLVTGGAWSLDRVDRLVEDIGDALITAHGLGVHHNDVSAANVLLDDTGAAYLTDFGIATEADDGTTVSAGAVRRDLRSFAWLAWELLTGPDDVGSARPTRRLQRDRPEPLIGRIPDVPAALDAVLASAASADGNTSSVAEFILGWRAAMGRNALDSTPVRRADEPSSSRRRAAAAMARSIVAGVNPYKGLRPFDESDADTYFGRDGAAAELATLVGRHRLVTVVGPSGSGKSSLVKAGLVPLLRSSGATVVSMLPGKKPTVALRDALVSVSPTPLRGRDGLANLRTVARRAGRLVIVVDQFEEVWTIGDEDDRVEFIGALVSAIGDERLDVSVVTTIRADRFDLPLQDPTIGPEIGAGTYAIGPMSAAQVAEAILGPARRAGVDVDDGVVADLVAAAVEPGTLPMLQFTLAELYESRRDGCIGREALEAIGGMAGVIGRTAERVYAGLEPVEQRAARDLLCRLVVLGDDGVATRRRATFSEMWPDARTVADDFVAARMLVVDRDPASREPTVEISHEALVTRWPRLARWIDEDRQWLAQLHHLTASTRAWRASGCDRAELYRGARLEAALEAVDAGRLVSAEECDFLEAGRHLRDVAIVDAHRSARRLRVLLAGTGLALVVALVAGSVAVIQRGRADDAATEAIAEAERADSAARSASIAEREAKIEGLVGRAESIRSSQRATSALLAVEAFRMDDTANTRSALFSTFTNEHGFLDAHTIDQAHAPPGVVMPDGETAFIGGDDGRIRPYDLESGAVGEPLPALADDVGAVALLRPSPDGRYLAQVAATVGNRDAIVGIFDLETGSLVFDPVRFGDTEDSGFASATFGPDGRYLFITRAKDGELLAIDAQTGETHVALAGVAPASGDAPWNGGGVAAASNNRIVVGIQTGAVTILDADTFEIESTLTAPPNTTWTFRTAGDGALVVGDGTDGVFVLDVESASILWQDLDYSQSCALLAVVAERSAIYCADFYGRLVERDLATGELRRTLEGQNGHAGQLFSAHGGTELVSFAGEVPVVSRWRLDGSGPITRAMTSGWEVYAYSPDGTQLLLAHVDPSASVPSFKVVDMATGADVATVPAGFVPAMFGDHGRLEGATELANGKLRGASLDLASGERTDGTGVLLPRQPDIARWDPGKKTVLAAFYNEDFTRTEIWNLSRDGPINAPFETGRAYSMSASRDGTRIANATSTGIDIHDGRTGEVLGTIDAANVGAVFITIADQLVVASNDGGLTLYGLDDLQPIRTFPGSRGRIEELYSTDDGSIIASRGGDRTVSIFDTATGTQLGKPIVIADGEANFISLAPDGSTLAVGGGGTDSDSPVKVWSLDPASWVDAACRLAGRNLSHEEWDSYIGDLAPYGATCPEFPAGE